MLTMHFEGEDLARVRIRTAHPVWETVLSLRALRDRSRQSVLGGWRARTGARFPSSARVLLELCPPGGAVADFLLAGPRTHTWEEGLSAVLAADGERAVHTLGRALADYHRVGIAPYWERIQAIVDVERAFRLRVLGEGGVERLLTTLVTAVQWDAGTLRLLHQGEREIRLDGQGLVLAPSLFCGRHSVVGEFPGAPPVLFFPVSGELAQPLVPGNGIGPSAAGPDALSALLGPTRAAALQGVMGGTTTSELARRLGVAMSTASEHTKVLRDAGLITTGRMGRQVMHAITPLGAALSNQTQPRSNP